MKKIISITFVILTFLFMPFGIKGKEVNPDNSFIYVIKSGDTLWKISVKYEVGISEIVTLNPQIVSPDMIFPNQQIKIPNLDAVKSIENEIIRLTNVERAKAGLPALKRNWQISRVARYKSEDMKNKGYFSHTSPTYGSPFTMLKNFGINFNYAGENIAYGQRTPQQVVNAWMNSSGHRANILNKNYTEIGVGFSEGYYYTQMFIGW